MSAMLEPASEIIVGGEVHGLGDGMIKSLSGTWGHAVEQSFELVPEEFDGVDDEPLDLDKPAHLEALKQAYERFPEIGGRART
ncbi:hypothetical protein F0U59_52585 [Archangium gephyra]|nr:hypothetical protein F0U59_52585 [Archangium gephyra]